MNLFKVIFAIVCIHTCTSNRNSNDSTCTFYNCYEPPSKPHNIRHHFGLVVDAFVYHHQNNNLNIRCAHMNTCNTSNNRIGLRTTCKNNYNRKSRIEHLTILYAFQNQNSKDKDDDNEDVVINTQKTNSYTRNPNNSDQIISQEEDPIFVDEADELFYYMNMFQEEEETNENEKLDLSDFNTKHNNEQLLNDVNNDNDQDVEKLIIPDLSTLLSSVTQVATKLVVDSSCDTITKTSNNTANNYTTYTKHIEQLAPAESIAYFYLQNTIGLSQHTMWRITNEVGSVLGFTTQNLKQKISFLQRMMNLSYDEIRIILTKQPSILHLSSNRNISQKVLFLVRNLDLSKDDLKVMVLAYPCILCYSIPNLQKKLRFLQFIMGIDDDDNDDDEELDRLSHCRVELRELLVRHPKLLIAAVDDSNYIDDDDYDDDNEYKNNKSNRQGRRGSGGLIAKYQFLSEEIGLSRDDLKYIVKKNPNILLYSLQNNLQPKLISLFIMRLRMDSDQICKVLKSFPQILDYNIDNYLLPITRYFLTDLEFSPMELRSIVLKFPKVYSHSLFKIKHVVGYLRYQLGMNASQVKRILFQAPQVISLNTDETLVSKVEFMRFIFSLPQNSSGLGEIRKIIAGMPTLLLCSVEKNLRPKAQYLLEQFNGDQLELRQAALTLPTLFGYSLEKRIKPRMKQIIEAGIEPIKITVGITMTETNFMKWLTNQKRSPRQGSMYQTEGRDGESNELSEQSQSLGAIVLWKNKDDDDSSRRIMHWKR